MPESMWIRRIAIHIFALAVFCLDTENCRTHVMPPINRAFPKYGHIRNNLIGYFSTVTSINFSITAFFFLKSTSENFSAFRLNQIRTQGEAHLSAAHNLGRGVLLAYSNFSSYFLGLLAIGATDSVASGNIFVVQPSLDQTTLEVLRKIRTSIAPRTLHSIQARTARTGIELLGALRAGHIVACPVDNVDEGSSALHVNFLGEATPYPAGMFGIAAKSNSAILPMHIEKQAGGYVVVFGEAILPDPSLNLPEQMQALAQHVAAHFEKATQRIPWQWESWRTLHYRWN